MGADRYGNALTAVDVKKAEFYGDSYITNNIIAVLKAEINEKQYRYYITDVLKAISNGASVDTRYYDLVESNETSAQESQEELSPEEVKSQIIEEFKRLGGG